MSAQMRRQMSVLSSSRGTQPISAPMTGTGVHPQALSVMTSFLPSHSPPSRTWWCSDHWMCVYSDYVALSGMAPCHMQLMHCTVCCQMPNYHAGQSQIGEHRLSAVRALGHSYWGCQQYTTTSRQGELYVTTATDRPGTSG